MIISRKRGYRGHEMCEHYSLYRSVLKVDCYRLSYIFMRFSWILSTKSLCMRWIHAFPIKTPEGQSLLPDKALTVIMRVLFTVSCLLLVFVTVYSGEKRFLFCILVNTGGIKQRSCERVKKMHTKMTADKRRWSLLILKVGVCPSCLTCFAMHCGHKWAQIEVWNQRYSAADSTNAYFREMDTALI